MQFSRRQTLALSGAFALAQVAPRLANAATPLRNKVAGTGSPASLASYKTAIGKMLDLDPRDGRNWFRQALIHIIDCPHRNWWFLPWHRGYLWNFENICRQMSGDDSFRLPYWDWTESASLPTAFTDAALDSGTDRFVNGYRDFRQGVRPVLDGLWAGYSAGQKAQLAERGLGGPRDVIDHLDGHFMEANGPRSLTSAAPELPDWASEPASQDSIKTILDARRFELFASGKSNNHYAEGAEGVLESQPHGSIHGATGGFMGAFLSPIDPIFWLHHANLDRLWHIWSERRKKASLPHMPEGADLTAWNREPFLFFHDKGGASLAKTSGDYVDKNILGYDYEPGSGEELAVAAPPLAIPAIQTFSALAINSELRAGFETSAAITGLAVPLQSAAKDDGPELYARISLTPPAELAGTRLRVYINCPYLSKYTPVEDPHFAGSVTFFSALHQGGHNHGDFTTTIPLGRALRALDQQNKLPVSAIKVQLITDTRDGSEVTDGLLKQVVIEAA